MAVQITTFAHKFIWDGVTYDKTAGGPFRIRVTKGGQVIEEWLDNNWPVYVEVVDRSMRVHVTVRDVVASALAAKIGTKGTINLYYRKKGTTTPDEVTRNISGMILFDIQDEQGRAAPGQKELVFAHENANGSTEPES